MVKVNFVHLLIVCKENIVTLSEKLLKSYKLHEIVNLSRVARLVFKDLVSRVARLVFKDLVLICVSIVANSSSQRTTESFLQ